MGLKRKKVLIRKKYLETINLYCEMNADKKYNKRMGKFMTKFKYMKVSICVS